MYSHCGFAVHDAVDKLAGWASSYGGKGPPPPADTRPSFSLAQEMCRWFPVPLGADAPNYGEDMNAVVVEAREVVIHPYISREPLPGWKDSARPFVAPINRRCAEAEQPAWRRDVAPPLDKPVSLLPCYVAKHLYRLRVGVDPDIGKRVEWLVHPVPGVPRRLIGTRPLLISWLARGYR